MWNDDDQQQKKQYIYWAAEINALWYEADLVYDMHSPNQNVS